TGWRRRTQTVLRCMPHGFGPPSENSPRRRPTQNFGIGARSLHVDVPRCCPVSETELFARNRALRDIAIELRQQAQAVNDYGRELAAAVDELRNRSGDLRRDSARLCNYSRALRSKSHELGAAANKPTDRYRRVSGV